MDTINDADTDKNKNWAYRMPRISVRILRFCVQCETFVQSTAQAGRKDLLLDRAQGPSLACMWYELLREHKHDTRNTYTVQR